MPETSLSPHPSRSSPSPGEADVAADSPGTPIASERALAHRPSGGTDERALAGHVGRALFLTVPAMLAFWVGIVAVAISESHVGYEAPLAMGAGVGVLAGLFWGAWLGVVRFSREELSRRQAARPAAEPRAPAPRPAGGRRPASSPEGARAGG